MAYSNFQIETTLPMEQLLCVHQEEWCYSYCREKGLEKRKSDKGKLSSGTFGAQELISPLKSDLWMCPNENISQNANGA